MLPVIAIIGQPNVGKSTLFNRLTKTQDALVHDMPGVTRDRHYGEGRLGDKPYIVIDTGGITGEEHGIDAMMAGQSWQAIDEADIVVFLTDARAGVTRNDQFIARKVRVLNKPVYLVVNKVDGLDEATAVADFYELGLGAVTAIAASHGRGVTQLMALILSALPAPTEPEEVHPGIKIAVVGRPNVGKSTLINRLLGEERVVVYDQPGTTRDSIYIPMERDGKRYTLIDTAGVRRRKSIHEALEKFSVVKTLQAIENCDVVIYLIDGQETLTDQDLNLLSFVIESGRALVVAVNKWDNLDEYQRRIVKDEMDKSLHFVDFARQIKISALHGTNVGHLFDYVLEAYECATQMLSTSRLTRILCKLVEGHQPPLVHGRRIKLRYAHAGGHSPPVIVIHGNQTESVPITYQRYLISAFCKALKLVGTPIRLTFKTSDNPYEGRKNILTPRQRAKRERMKRHFKKNG